jgi:transposase
VTRVEELVLEPELRTQLQPLLRVMTLVNDEIEAADRRLVRTAKTDPIVQRLQSAPQVGPITALAFVAALDGVRRFRNAHQVESYLGLVPRERSSGEHQLRGRIAKTGDKRVRWLLVETAWRLMMRRSKTSVVPLQAWTTKISTRRGRTIAAVALARRLAGILYAMWRDDRDFDQQRIGRPRKLAEVA